VNDEIAATSAEARVSPLAMLAWTLPQVTVAGLAASDARLWAGDQQGLSEHAIQAMTVAQSVAVGLLLPMLARTGRSVVAALASGTAFLCLAGVLENAEWADVAGKCGWSTAIFATAMGVWQLLPRLLWPAVHVLMVVWLSLSHVLAYVGYDVADGEKSDILKSSRDFLPTAAYTSYKALYVAVLCVGVWLAVLVTRRVQRSAAKRDQTGCSQRHVNSHA
jgi:hypothetical protein